MHPLRPTRCGARTCTCVAADDVSTVELTAQAFVAQLLDGTSITIDVGRWTVALMACVSVLMYSCVGDAWRVLDACGLLWTTRGTASICTRAHVCMCACASARANMRVFVWLRMYVYLYMSMYVCM